MLALEDRAADLDPDAATSNLAARGLLDRIRLHDSDPNRIASLGQIYDAYIGGKLRNDDFNLLRKEVLAKQTPPDAPPLPPQHALPNTPPPPTHPPHPPIRPS